MTTKIPKPDFPIIVSNNNPIVQLPTRLSVLEAVAFKETVDELIGKYSPEKLTLNFKQTQFIDSSAIGALVHVLKSMRSIQGELILENVQPPVMAVLSMTGLAQVLNIESQTIQSSSSQKSNQDLPTTHPSIRSKVKRSLDILGSIVGLGITGILFIPIAIAIKLDSPGPIFFSQVRCGWMGKKFRLWKFRSMCQNAEALKDKIPNQVNRGIFKNDNDPRITRVGRFLRKTSLDELPQFWNVLSGEMSLVGTRPPTPDEVEHYEVPEWQRLDVKPGMTGEWQVNGRSTVRNFEDVIKLDLRYQQSWNLIYDLKLILKTVMILFNKNSGAV